MKNLEYRAFLDLIMCSDPWPLDEQAYRILTKFADGQAKERGFPDWIYAYHKFDGAEPDLDPHPAPAVGERLDRWLAGLHSSRSHKIALNNSLKEYGLTPAQYDDLCKRLDSEKA